MGVVIARFMVVGRWCSTSEMGKQSPKKKSDKPQKQEGCTNLNWYSTPANYDFHVYVDSYFVTSVIF